MELIVTHECVLWWELVTGSSASGELYFGALFWDSNTSGSLVGVRMYRLSFYITFGNSFFILFHYVSYEGILRFFPHLFVGNWRVIQGACLSNQNPVIWSDCWYPFLGLLLNYFRYVLVFQKLRGKLLDPLVNPPFTLYKKKIPINVRM